MTDSIFPQPDRVFCKRIYMLSGTFQAEFTEMSFENKSLLHSFSVVRYGDADEPQLEEAAAIVAI
ncbi:MAG: hypothetical protein H6873_10135 [Hyphomicrobiaceae bacterium]|nr:hypothetical protein [Hyphomicrobiaceae bacterium]